MSDMMDVFRDMQSHKRMMRAQYGHQCPVCRDKRPKAHASILLPQQRCRVDGYRDPRPELTADQLGETPS
jgi:hypothetical protein